MDVSEGVGLDSSVIYVVDFTAGEVVAEYVSDSIEPDLLAYEIRNLSLSYGNCLVAVERNNCGLTTVTKLRELNVPQYYEEEMQSGTTQKTKSLGWRTTSKSKPLMLFDLKDALTEKVFKLVSPHLYKEIKTYNPDDLRRIHFDPEQTRHWDRVMACFVKGTMVLTDEGQRPIESIKIGDRVMTRQGLKAVAATCSHVKEVTTNIGLTGTTDHPVFCNNNETKDLSSIGDGDKLYIWDSKAQKIERLSYIEVFNTIDTPMRRSGTIGYISRVVLNGKRRAFTCIDKFGLIILEICQRAISFITKMAIRAITQLGILNVCQNPSIANYMPQRAEKEVGNGSKQTEKKSIGEFGNTIELARKNLDVPFAEKALRVVATMRSIALRGVTWMLRTQRKENPSRGKYVQFAKKGLKQQCLIRSGVPKSAISLGGESAQQTVYNLRVADCPEYFANNILVHNCAIALQMRDFVPEPINHLQSPRPPKNKYSIF